MVSSSVSMDRWRSVLVERSVRSQKIMSFFLSLVKQNSHSDTTVLSSIVTNLLENSEKFIEEYSEQLLSHGYVHLNELVRPGKEAGDTRGGSGPVFCF